MSANKKSLILTLFIGVIGGFILTSLSTREVKQEELLIGPVVSLQEKDTSVQNSCLSLEQDQAYYSGRPFVALNTVNDFCIPGNNKTAIYIGGYLLDTSIIVSLCFVLRGLLKIVLKERR